MCVWRCWKVRCRTWNVGCATDRLISTWALRRATSWRPVSSCSPGLLVQRLFSNPRAVFCRKDHPLASARSLKALAHAQWAVTSVDYDASEDLTALFRGHDLPVPEVAMRVRSVASILMGIAHTDLLAMLPIQCSESAMTQHMLQQVHVRDEIPPTPIVLIQRADVPMTPASEYFCDALLRQGPRVEHGPPRKRAAGRDGLQLATRGLSIVVRSR